MQVKKIYIKGSTIRIPTGFIGYISKYSPGVLTESDLPKKVIIVDPIDNKEYNCSLIEVVPFTDSIPSVLCLLSEGEYPDKCISEIFKRTKTDSINQLAFYLYAC